MLLLTTDFILEVKTHHRCNILSLVGDHKHTAFIRKNFLQHAQVLGRKNGCTQIAYTF